MIAFQCLLLSDLLVHDIAGKEARKIIVRTGENFGLTSGV